MVTAVMVVVLLSCASVVVMSQKYNAVFSFGDSITDTGNLCTDGKPSAITFTQPPYGETFFGKPTCRCSDGRVIVDFLCDSLGLPFLAPSKSTSADFKQGANMAITGATAMDADFFRSLGLSDKIWNNGPISFQLQWFQHIFSSLCTNTSSSSSLATLAAKKKKKKKGKGHQVVDCKRYLGSSLLVFGEFGGNDYNAMLFGGYSADQASTYTPSIVDAISSAVERLLAMGAKDVVVPGVLPIGCFPIYLSIYGTSSLSDYDSLGCLKKLNDLSTYHNGLLQAKLAALQSKYAAAAARIMYADFYAAVYDMVRSPSSYGFSAVFEACCGSGGGKYNYANSARCGMTGAAACASPASHLSWDGIHLTEAAYKQITDGWLSGAYCHPAILH